MPLQVSPVNFSFKKYNIAKNNKNIINNDINNNQANKNINNTATNSIKNYHYNINFSGNNKFIEVLDLNQTCEYLKKLPLWFPIPPKLVKETAEVALKQNEINTQENVLNFVDEIIMEATQSTYENVLYKADKLASNNYLIFLNDNMPAYSSNNISSFSNFLAKKQYDIDLDILDDVDFDPNDKEENRKLLMDELDYEVEPAIYFFQNGILRPYISTLLKFMKDMPVDALLKKAKETDSYARLKTPQKDVIWVLGSELKYTNKRELADTYSDFYWHQLDEVEKDIDDDENDTDDDDNHNYQ